MTTAGHRTTRSPGSVPHRPLAGIRALGLAPVGGYGGFNTSVHRMRALRSLGIALKVVDSTVAGDGGLGGLDGRLRAWLFRQGLPVRLPDPAATVGRLLAAAADDWDLVWLEKALTIGASEMAPSGCVASLPRGASAPSRSSCSDAMPTGSRWLESSARLTL